jgi:hypothetical protein
MDNFFFFHILAPCFILQEQYIKNFGQSQEKEAIGNLLRKAAFLQTFYACEIFENQLSWTRNLLIFTK